MATAKKKARGKKAHAPMFMRVRRSFYLHWPKELGVARGPTGYIVDMNAPLEAEWCRGQMHKLERAPDATEATSIDDCPAARNARKKALGQMPVDAPEPVKGATMRTAAAKAGESAEGAMRPVQPEFGDEGPMTPEATS